MSTSLLNEELHVGPHTVYQFTYIWSSRVLLAENADDLVMVDTPLIRSEYVYMMSDDM